MPVQDCRPILQNSTP